MRLYKIHYTETVDKVEYLWGNSIDDVSRLADELAVANKLGGEVYIRNAMQQEIWDIQEEEGMEE